MNNFVFLKKEELQNLIRTEVEIAVMAALTANGRVGVKDATPKYLNRQEAADMLHVSLSTVHRLVNQKYLKCRKVGRKSLFLLADVEKVIITLNK